MRDLDDLEFFAPVAGSQARRATKEQGHHRRAAARADRPDGPWRRATWSNRSTYRRFGTRKKNGNVVGGRKSKEASL